MGYSFFQIKLGLWGTDTDLDVVIRRNGSDGLMIRRYVESEPESGRIERQYVFLSSDFLNFRNHLVSGSSDYDIEETFRQIDSFLTINQDGATYLGSLFVKNNKLKFRAPHFNNRPEVNFYYHVSKNLMSDEDEDLFNKIISNAPYSVLESQLPFYFKHLVTDDYELSDEINHPIFVDPQGETVTILLPYPVKPSFRFPIIIKRIGIDESDVIVKIKTDIHYIDNSKVYYLGKDETVMLYPSETGYFIASSSFGK